MEVIYNGARWSSLPCPTNDAVLHSAIGYVTPADKLAGREKIIYQQRDQKLALARARRQRRRAETNTASLPVEPPQRLCSVNDSGG